MAAEPPAVGSGRYQADFHRRWSDLTNPHVRALAWLLDAPDLLDRNAARWQGRVATLGGDAGEACRDWLLALDADPQALADYLDVHKFTRLGRYAESLLAWYFRHRRTLVAHGLQVRADEDQTVGEFDFLLRQGSELLHLEFATKFYLLNSSDPKLADVQQADYFVGPNLSDTLGHKIRKILERQLMLGSHPAAQALLPQPLSGAQALMKGWLFYRRGELPPLAAAGVSPNHCRGWWCTLQELGTHLPGPGAMLPRIAWLAPARLPESRTMAPQALEDSLQVLFARDPMPVMVVSLEQQGDVWLECERGFVVPDQWPAAAAARRQA